MPSVPLIAQRSFPYAGQSVVSGQCFLALSEYDALALKTVGHAIDAPLESDPLDPQEPELIEDVKPKRVYRRRRVETAD